MISTVQTTAIDPLDNTAEDPTRSTPLVLGGLDLTTLTDEGLRDRGEAAAVTRLVSRLRGTPRP